MERNAYRAQLARLPIKNPTPEDMAAMCPHLTREGAVKAFKAEHCVACPPLRIRGGFQIVSCSEEWVEQIVRDGVVTGTKNHPATLDWAYSGRTPASYVYEWPHGDVFIPYVHMDRAMKFAEDNWGEELILDTWVSAVECIIQDPTDLINDQYHRDDPRTKAVLGMALNRDTNAVNSDHSKPESALYDEIIAEMTLDHMVWSELKGGRGGGSRYNCAHCGAGLGLSSCSGCGHSFRDNQLRSGWSTPLSKKMVAFLREHGHVFAIDPEIAWTKEQARWEKAVKEYEELLGQRQAP
ncbi:MAG: hypothetical protein WCV84_05565 [Patescibacteria group bacterium]